MPKKSVSRAVGMAVFGPQVVLRPNKGGKWIFPKGHLEPGETALQAALRETEEETGLLLEADGSVRFKTADEKVEVEYFIPRALGPGPRWEKHQNLDTFLIPPEQVAAHLSCGRLWRLREQVSEPFAALADATRP